MRADVLLVAGFNFVALAGAVMAAFRFPLLILAVNRAAHPVAPGLALVPPHLILVSPR